MACFEDEVRDKLKVDPLVARAFLNQTLELMKRKLDAAGILRDGLGVEDALSKVAEKSGLTVKTVAKIIQADDKLFSISKQAFNRVANANAVKSAARNIAENGTTQTGNILRVYNDIRRLALTGHAPVFPWTHARNLLFGTKEERQIFYGMVHDAWAFRGEKGDLNHSTALAEMKGNKDYRLAVSTGLPIKEGTLKGDILRPPETGTILSQKMTEYSKAISESKLGKFLRLDPNNAAKAFDAVKIGRWKLWKHYWDQSPDALKTEARARFLSRDMAYATGGIPNVTKEASQPIDRLVKAASEASGNVLLSSNLFYGKRMEAANILRYGPARFADIMASPTLRTDAMRVLKGAPRTEEDNVVNVFKPGRFGISDLLSKGGKMTPEERSIANLGLKRWGRITAIQLGILGTNLAFAKAMGLKLPNLTDPTKADYGRIRIGNFISPISPMWEAVKEPIRAVSTAIQKRSAYEGAKELVRPVVNALTPGVQLTVEQATGKEPFSSRNVPSIRNVIQKPKPTHQPAVTPGEYVSTRFAPIAISGALREFYQALRNEGVPASHAIAFIKGAAGGLTSGLAGTHIYEEEPKKPAVKLPRQP